MPQTRTRKRLEVVNVDTGEVRYVVAPLGTSIMPGDIVHLLSGEFEPWTGLYPVTNCIVPLPPPLGAPEWNWFSVDIPDPIAGERFSLRIPLDALTPAEGEFINETGIITVSSWLGGYYDPGSSEYNLTGIVPPQGRLTLILYGRQTADSGSTPAGLTTTKTFTKPILTYDSFTSIQ